MTIDPVLSPEGSLPGGVTSAGAGVPSGLVGLLLAQVRGDIDSFLLAAIPERSGAAGRLAEAMRYAAIGGGKRFRAALTVAVAELTGGAYDQALRVAAAIECVHAQSLVHDDLPCMDDDELRRGKPTLHRAFGEATAVLAGDALLALAFGILADPATHPDGAVRATLIAELAQALGPEGLAGGQMMDLFPEPDAGETQMLACETRKTGALIRFAVSAGATLGGCDGPGRESLLRFAEKLGLAFQMRDDVLDKVGEPSLLGKRVRKDAAAGRRSAVEVLGLGQAKARSGQLVNGCLKDLSRFGASAGILSQIAGYALERAH